MNVYKAPEEYPLEGLKVFLAGSIEMGKVEDWQTELTNALEGLDVTILNPRRDDWDSSWEQTIHNEKFREQVEWELKAQTEADLIVMYFAPETQSPITLMELGLFKDKDMVVCCPDGFWRKGNVEVVCNAYQIPLIETKEQFIDKVKKIITGMTA